MVRKAPVYLSLLLMSLVLVVFTACGSETAQNEGGNKEGGSAPDKKGQAAGEGTSKQPGSSEGVGSSRPT